MTDTRDQVELVLGTPNMGDALTYIGLLSLFCVEFDPDKSKFVKLEKHRS
jgi:hypothetical protein